MPQILSIPTPLHARPNTLDDLWLRFILRTSEPMGFSFFLLRTRQHALRAASRLTLTIDTEFDDVGILHHFALLVLVASDIGSLHREG